MSLALPHQGYLQRQTAPLVRAGSDSLKAIAGLLGSPQKAFAFSPDHVRSVETFTLSRLAEGKPEYVGFSITSAMQSSNAAIIELMPMLKTDATTFVSEYFSFPKELPAAAPAQSPPSYVEVEKRSREVTLEHYTLGATTTVQELRTAEGQFIFRGKLITVAVGFIEMAELLAIDALLTLPTLYAQYWLEAGQHPVDLQRTGRMTDLYWDIMRSRDNGFAELVDMVRQAMSSQNIKPTHVIMTEGMRSLMMASSMKTEYSRFGPGASTNAERLGDAVGDTFDGLRFIVVRGVELRKKDLRISPLERNVIIGQHFRIDHFHDNCDEERWCSKFYTIQVYSMDTDTWQTIGALDALDADGRFASSDGLLSDHHNALAEQLDNMARKSGVPVYQGQYDMFIYLSRADSTAAPVANVAALWGHMEQWALIDKTADRTARGTALAVRRAIPAESLAAIRQGIEDIRELYERNVGDDDVRYLRAEGPPGRYGVRAVVQGGEAVPPGYGSVAGYLELASAAGVATLAFLDQNLVGRAVAFKKAAVQLHAFFVSLYGLTHPALDPANAPASYRLATAGQAATNASKTTASLLNFFQNIVDTPKAMLYIVPEAGAAAAGGQAEEIPAAFDDVYGGLNAVFAAVGNAPELVAVFGRGAGPLEAFETAFKNSTFKTRYEAYVSEARASARRTRASRQALSADAEQPAEFGDAADALAEPLQRFHTREVVARNLNPAQTASLYSNVIAAVRTGRAPARVTADLLAAWTRDRAAALPADLQTPAPENAGLTGFVASLEALRQASEEARASIALASPVNPGRAVNVAAAGGEMDGAGANVDLLRTTLSGASAAAASPVAGLRDRPPAGATQSELNASLFGGIGGAVPAFARDAFTDVVGSQIVVNENIRSRFARYGAEADWLFRVCGQMFVTAPIAKRVLQRMYALDIPLPVAWLVEQFNRRYTTASMIFVSKPSTRPFGNIRYMDADTHQGRNAINKNLMINVTMYMAATPENVEDWFVAHDTAVVGYSGGENTVAFDMDDWNINGLDKLPLDGPSLLYFMVPADSLVGKIDGKAPQTHDIRGYFDPIHHSGQSVHRESQFAERPHHKSALFYTTKLELHRIATPTSADWTRFHRREGTFNTTTHQGLQRVINPHTLNYDLVVMSCDPFKDNVYPLCRDLRTSALPRVYRQTHYGDVAISC